MSSQQTRPTFRRNEMSQSEHLFRRTRPGLAYALWGGLLVGVAGLIAACEFFLGRSGLPTGDVDSPHFHRYSAVFSPIQWVFVIGGLGLIAFGYSRYKRHLRLMQVLDGASRLPMTAPERLWRVARKLYRSPFFKSVLSATIAMVITTIAFMNWDQYQNPYRGRGEMHGMYVFFCLFFWFIALVFGYKARQESQLLRTAAQINDADELVGEPKA